MMPQATPLPPSLWFIRDEILKKVVGFNLTADAFRIVPVKVEGLPHNWEVQINAQWTGSDPSTYHRHAIAIQEAAAEVQRDHPLAEFGE